MSYATSDNPLSDSYWIKMLMFYIMKWDSCWIWFYKFNMKINIEVYILVYRLCGYASHLYLYVKIPNINIKGRNVSWFVCRYFTSRSLKSPCFWTCDDPEPHIRSGCYRKAAYIMHPGNKYWKEGADINILFKGTSSIPYFLQQDSYS